MINSNLDQAFEMANTCPILNIGGSAEVRNIIQDAYERTKQLLRDRNTELETIAQELLNKEIIFQTDLERLIGKRPFDKEEREVLDK